MKYYDDNFGHWDDMDDPDMREFYFKVQQTNVKKECDRCGARTVRWAFWQYSLGRYCDCICNSCAERMEIGEDWFG